MADGAARHRSWGAPQWYRGHSKQPQAPVTEPARAVHDETGRVWTVTERALPSDDAEGGASLLFACDFSIRRVRVYPRNWFELSDADLFAVSLGR